MRSGLARRYRVLAVLSMVALAALACQLAGVTATPAPAPTAPVPTLAVMEPSPTSTSTPAPTATLSATSTRTPTPAATATAAKPTTTPTRPVPAIDPQTVRPLGPKQYCWNPGGAPLALATPPAGFLYQPFEADFVSQVWSAQVDHVQPNYTQNGAMASLGESLAYEARGAEAHALDGSARVPQTRPYQALLQSGYYIFAYLSPRWGNYIYYDGHDGHDFAVGGAALAAADGTITKLGDYRNGLGRVVDIYHPQGYLTRYAHLGEFAPGLVEGSAVRTGQPLGKIGGSAWTGGQLKDGQWGTHLHFAIFHWNAARAAWQITDPFGWDPWEGPAVQGKDPLAACNAEVSYNLWVDGWPRLPGVSGSGRAFRPEHGRYLGGWLGDEPLSASATASPTVRLYTPRLGADPTATTLALPR